LTPYYDTLLQMGRWFGYRGDYVDLTRLYSTQLLISWFHDLATAEEDLRRQVELYDKRKATPLQFAPKVMSHPVMLVTAENKMRDAQEITQSYDGELVQTLRFPFGDPALIDRLQENLDYTGQMLSSLGPPTDSMNGRPAWADVGVDFVQEFLDNFWVMDQTAIHPPTVRSYIQAQVRQHELARWRVLVCCAATPVDQLGREDLKIAGLDEVGLINRSRLAKDPTSLGVITDPSDELFGLSPEDVADAEKKAENKEYPTRGKAYRSKRSPQEGLLLIYPISGNSVPGRNARNRVRLFEEHEERRTVIGYAISFPFSRSPATVTYIQGPESRRR
jgi:Z1 domain